LVNLLQAEFGSEGFAIRSDRLDISLGFDGGVIGVAPDSEIPNGSNRLELDTTLTVQFYGPWSEQSDPNEIVDPITVETWAWRFRMLISNYQQTGTSSVWYFQLGDLEYGDDPTGNCTRFIASVVARGENPAY
jgi:hypothetical protein